MHLRLTIRNWQIYFAITHSVRMLGVNSLLDNGHHFLMWDFDNQDIPVITAELLRLQDEWDLSDIYILQSSVSGYYHAYCFTQFGFPFTLAILSSTKGIDMQFFKIGVIRGYFTLRITDKRSGHIKLHTVLETETLANVDPYECHNFDTYWTKRL